MNVCRRTHYMRVNDVVPDNISYMKHELFHSYK